MLLNIINYSLRHKFVVLLFVAGIIGFGIYALQNIPIGAVPDITNNQVQVISTSRNLPTEEVERYLTYPVELEMGNLPGVEEIRSISKFGLSVVTIVFDDKMGTYLPRQLISEKLKGISDEIPEGFGSPTMGPISTGLGEIYQYILDVKPGYEDQYDVTDLRSIQDWIVKRQLSGIPGVVEVNTWGGFLKTYEVAVNPNSLQAMSITLSEVYEALTSNNTVAGGGYIEKTNETYFIRAEGLVKTIEDIESIVIKKKGTTPIYIKDIADVGFGAATRFGAITGNGEGEKVLGQVMMLKGADSKKVIDAVIDRVNTIQASLPEGVFINPFLERSELIDKTTFTISENLILGFLIVLLVVVFLLGNIRSGLLVASVIPLTLLFALSLMYIFGIDANLMSLGAIDFGIIIDGAVIIVEYIAFSITQNSSHLNTLKVSARQGAMDNLVSKGTGKMMHSAIFGQIIIIIVFIPILALTGIEGKMFRPMALTFCFALLGAMILCFTYVPVVAALFLKPTTSTKPTLSSKFMKFMKGIYKPVLVKVLKAKVIVLIFAIAAFVFTVVLFSRMGGEFVPTLDEGDFVIQPVLKTGMSLAETVNMTTRIEKIIKRFPEVKQVVSRIGAAEVPTDPMSMEESDVIITLKKKGQWTSASTKDELADVFKEALIAEIPGIEIEFTQPIEMRFNELISGARADLAIKLFGEDLDILYAKSSEIEDAIKNVEGAADISVEKIDGLPQMSIQYDRSKIARYGINIDKLNEVISMGFAGRSAGIIYEGESKFDIVIKYKKEFRSDIDHLRNALIDLPSGQQLPLSEFASIKYSTGPAKISRDNTKRRVVIGVNVRGRDLQSVVDEVRSIIESKVQIPSGYYVQYGGQFENLEKATQRLLVAVPIALILIFILLYFAFGSIKEALLVYSAIPLATIGGVLALYSRGMPFSISAGIGFIALFGIAVLNGIVMIEHFKELKTKGMKNLNDIILEGAVDRLRPVLLTAFAAAMGFLPMAISSSAGAEVQRPLATVVIGGLVSATLLTLVVLPVLYSIFTDAKKINIGKVGMWLLLITFIIPSSATSQQSYLNLDQLLDLTLENNNDHKINTLNLEKEKVNIDAVKEINKTDVFYSWDKNNITDSGGSLHVIGFEHSFKMPSFNSTRKVAQEANVALQESKIDLVALSLKGKVVMLFDKIQYLESMNIMFQEVDSIYAKYLLTTDRKYQQGSATVLEKLAINQKRTDIELLTQQISWDLSQAYYDIQNIVQSDSPFQIEINKNYDRLVLETKTNSLDAVNNYYTSLIQLSKKQEAVKTSESLPELNLSLFNGFDKFDDIFYPGVQVGLSLPLSKKHYKARLNATKIDTDIAQLQYDFQSEYLQRNQKQILEKLNFLNKKIELYNSKTTNNIDSLNQSASKALNGGEINYLQYLLLLETVTQAKIKKLELLHEYNQTLISLNYLLN